MESQRVAAKEQAKSPPPTTAGHAVGPASRPDHPVLRLQQQIGNQAVQRLVQARRAISVPDDPYEREAEQAAQHVVSGSLPDGLQRRCACGGVAGAEGECAACRRKRLGLQRRAVHSEPSSVVPPSVARALNTPGRLLDTTVRTQMEAHFGHDFGEVRVHTGPEADASARAIDALAYTTGQQVVFGAGQYAPHTAAGRKLLAHELTHVVQQAGAAGGNSLEDAAPADLSGRGDDTAFEREARGAARAVSEGTPASRIAPAGSPPRLQKFTEEEHERLGNVTGVDKIDLGNGVVLSWGQLIALAGDHYASDEDLLNDTRTPDGRTRILARMQYGGISAPAAAFGPAPTPADKEKAAINELLLGLRNTPHFVAGGTAVASWVEAHERAIAAAVTAGLARDRKQLDRAYFVEAFGQHFLTDAFSSGHMRTPRQDINNYYVNDFAPRVVDHMIETLRERLVDAIYDQMDPRGDVRWPMTSVIRREIRSALQNSIDEGLAAIGGHDKLVEYVGLFLGGLVSRALHDLDNKSGLWVSSADHPEPWQAFGDHLLDAPDPVTGVPVNRQEAEKAILIAKLDLDAAYAIAEQEARKRDEASSPPPEVVYFDFNSDSLRFDVKYQLTRVANYMTYYPDVTVRLVGHTDPIDTDAYNFDLGLRRAEAVAKDLEGQGVDPARILSPESKGETALVTTDPKRYGLNRRVALIFEAGVIGTSSPDVAFIRTWEEVGKRIRPPYAALDYLPEPIDAMNAPVKNYIWGNLPYDVQAEMAAYITGKIKTYGSDLIGKLKDNQKVQELEKTRNIKLIPIAQGLLDWIEASPISFMEDVFDRRKAGP